MFRFLFAQSVRRPSYIVVSSVVLLISIFGLTLRAISPLLPPQEANALRAEQADYLRQGIYQRIDWRPLSAQAFEEAARQDRIIMLVLGAAWSEDGRRADNMVFTDSDIQSLVRRRFLPIRADLDQFPDWTNTFVPMLRPHIGMERGWQVWFFSPDGVLLDYFRRDGTSQLVDPLRFYDTLVRAMRENEAGELALQQRAFRFQLAGQQVAGEPQYGAMLRRIEEAIHPRNGGQLFSDSLVHRPSAWKLQLMLGQSEAFGRSMDPLLASPIVDWLDGGFFRLSNWRGWGAIEYDKHAAQNAEIMHVLAVAGRLYDNPLYRLVAEKTFDALASDFVRNGLIVSARIGDELPNGRSGRSSFTVRELRLLWGSGELTRDEKLWARERFRLVVPENPQLSIKVPDPALPFERPEEFENMLAKLRRMRSDRPAPFTSQGYADIHGYVVARLLEVARLWNDQERLSRAVALRDRLELFRTGDDIRHSLDWRQYPLLTDYLSFADAMLMDYMATGRSISFMRGAAVLARAQFLFETPVQGVWNASARSGRPWPADSQGPDLVDSPYESLASRMIRLCQAYGSMLNGSEEHAELSQRFRQCAMSAFFQYGFSSEQFPVSFAGFFSAALTVGDDGHGVAVGPDALELASELARRTPTRLVFPAYGDVRQDLQSREPGIYVVRGGQIHGPLDVDQAAALLPSVYPVGLPDRP
jgi:uncharacterized protein YyaL (SSP411 family)